MTKKEMGILDQILAEVKEMRKEQSALEGRVEALEKGKAVRTTSKTKAKTKTPAPTTKKAAIAAKYSDEERAAYGKAAAEVRSEMMAENAVMRPRCEASGDWTSYLKGERWNREFKKRMAKRGFGNK